jgi:hypothetical protein
MLFEFFTKGSILTFSQGKNLIFYYTLEATGTAIFVYIRWHNKDITGKLTLYYTIWRRKR